MTRKDTNKLYELRFYVLKFNMLFGDLIFRQFWVQSAG